ncbi:MAG TPA: ATP-dependent endonuclease [Bacteroidia bacterium]|nr:ATP-dependent endonuclease [Bacteroidia bacterium]
MVEGDSDELVVQKAFMVNNDGNLPIEKGIDVISVGTSFLRFLEIAEKINKPVTVVTDNDGNLQALENKYDNYLGKKAKKNIQVCYDNKIETGDLKVGDKPFNYNTLEPKILALNGLANFNTLFGTSFTEIDDIHKYMRANKTDCAIKIFDSKTDIKFPVYILNAIK